MPNAKDISPELQDYKVFVCGDSGTGKSIFASTFPTPGFVFDFDKGIDSYRGKDFDYEQFDLSPQGWVQFEKTLMTLEKELKEDCRYKTIIIDSTTVMTDLAMERSMQLDPKRSATNGPLWNVHYQMVKNLVEGKLRKIINLPCNIVVIAHLENITNQETGALIGIEPLLTGNLSKRVPGYFSEVYYANVKQKDGKNQYLMQTVNKGFYKARSRMRGVEDYLEDYVPNDYNKIMEMLGKNIKKGGK
jgi:hypothetical protein